MPGRTLDLELLWKEKGSETELGAVYKQDKQKKVSGKYVPPPQHAASSQTMPGCVLCLHTEEKITPPDSRNTSQLMIRPHGG